MTDFPAPPSPASEPLEPGAIRIIDVYPDAGSTKIVLQSRQALVTGRSLYVGLDESPVTVGAVLSRSGGIYYYAASAPGNLAAKPGDAVRVEQTRKLSLPAALLDSLRASHGFEQKSVAEITAVQGDRVMIDKGTLHEIHERDLFRIVDASGVAKGFIEVRGIGDMQSSALFNKYKGAAETRPGDYAIFEGQRRLFGIGLMAGGGIGRKPMLIGTERSAGGGLLWSMTFYNGWGLEALFGFYNHGGKDRAENAAPIASRQAEIDNRTANFILPISLKKNFFYPSLVSPFISAGAYWLEAKHSHEVTLNFLTIGNETTVRHGLYPQVALGVEFLPTRFFRPRLEMRHFFAPRLEARGSFFSAESTVYSLGVLTSW